MKIIYWFTYDFLVAIKYKFSEYLLSFFRIVSTSPLTWNTKCLSKPRTWWDSLSALQTSDSEKMASMTSRWYKSQLFIASYLIYQSYWGSFFSLFNLFFLCSVLGPSLVQQCRLGVYPRLHSSLYSRSLEPNGHQQLWCGWKRGYEKRSGNPVPHPRQPRLLGSSPALHRLHLHSGQVRSLVPKTSIRL